MRQILFTAFICVFFSSCTFWRILSLNKPSINDHKHFPSATMHKSDQPFEFQYHTEQNTLPPIEDWISDKFKDQYSDIESFLEATNTSSFMVIQRDSILYEQYFGDHQKDKQIIVFSLTKPFITSLLSKAIEEGYISDINEPVYKYVPEFEKDSLKKKITLAHLAQMTSGLEFNDYTDLLKLARTYYSKHLKKTIKSVDVKYEPGTHFAYKSVDTQLLGLCLEKATGKNIHQYLEEKLWQPLGMEHNAYFTQDHQHGMERCFGGMAACAIDLAKFGRLYLNNGQWEGEQIIEADWVQSIQNRRLNNNIWYGYNYGWWRDGFVDQNLMDIEEYFAAGYGGQIIYINPDLELIIVRQGKSKGGANWYNIAGRLANAIEGKIINKNKLTTHYPGEYKSQENEHIEIRFNQAKSHYEVIGLPDRKKTIFEYSSPQCLRNEKEFLGLLYEWEKGALKGVYFDNGNNLKFYSNIN